MNDLIRHGHSSLNYSTRQNMQSSQPASEPQSFPSHNSMLMVSIFYIAPIALLAGMVFTKHLKRKLKLGRDIAKLSHVAKLERIFSLKSGKKVNS
jgi:flagellar biosynthesis protein FlhB